MWQSINGLIDQRTPKGLKCSASLGNVVHSDNDEESLYACCCTQKVTVKGCHRCSILAVTVHKYLHEVQWINCKGMLLNLIKAKSAIFTFLSKFNAVQTKSSPSWTLTVSKSLTLTVSNC